MKCGPGFLGEGARALRVRIRDGDESDRRMFRRELGA
jgi:hypothetical protein